jgi:hypothetical protein
VKTRWLLAVLAFGTLLAFGVFLWWFGPWHATRAFGVWAVLNAPLVVIAYRMTRKRWLLYLGSGLLPWGLVVGLPSPSSLWGEPVGLLIIALSCGVPLALTAAWMTSLFPEPAGLLVRWLATAGPITITALVIVAVAKWAIADAQPPPVEKSPYVRTFAGCYEIEFGRWIPGGVEARQVTEGIVPKRIQLDTMRERNWQLIRPGWSQGDAYWSPVGPRKVRMLWTTGFGGLLLALRPSGGELRGRALIFTDADGFMPEPRALVRARPIACALVPADTVRMKTDGTEIK